MKTQIWGRAHIRGFLAILDTSSREKCLVCSREELCILLNMAIRFFSFFIQLQKENWKLLRSVFLLIYQELLSILCFKLVELLDTGINSFQFPLHSNQLV